MSKLVLMATDAIRLREYLKVILSVGKHEVIFTKKDGTQRTLNGTRDPNLIGQELFEKYTNPPPKADGTERVESITGLPVFDVEKSAWRSFSFDTLQEVDGINISTILQHAQIKIEG